MRRLGTPLIVAGVLVVGLLAAADALRGHDESRIAAKSTPTITRAAPPTLQEMLRRETITGFVVYSDGECVVHSLLLPRLVSDVVRTEDGEPLRLCRFTVAGGRFLEEGQVPNPDGTLVARCRDGLVVVSELESARQRRSFIGCPPAWRPNGRLTYPEGNRIMEEGHVLYSARELRAASRSHPNLQGFSGRIFVHATDLAWLDQDRVIVSLEARGKFVEPQYLTAMFLGKALVGTASRFGQPSGNWMTSPSGSYAAAEDGTLVTRDGDFTDPPQNLPTGQAVTFTPDEQWLVYVTGISVYLIGTPRNSEPGRIIRLPIPAQDLAWDAVTRGTAGVQPIRR